MLKYKFITLIGLLFFNLATTFCQTEKIETITRKGEIRYQYKDTVLRNKFEAYHFLKGFDNDKTNKHLKKYKVWDAFWQATLIPTYSVGTIWILNEIANEELYSGTPGDKLWHRILIITTTSSFTTGRICKTISNRQFNKSIEAFNNR